MRSPGFRLSIRLDCFREEILKAKQVTRRCPAAVGLILTSSYVLCLKSVSVWECVSPLQSDDLPSPSQEDITKLFISYASYKNPSPEGYGNCLYVQ